MKKYKTGPASPRGSCAPANKHGSAAPRGSCAPANKHGSAAKGDPCHPACDMRGFLSFLILWLLSKQPMSGCELAEEIGRRKGGCKPNPGTIYPALKELVRKKAIAPRSSQDKQKIYALTAVGRAELARATDIFSKTFYDLFTR